MFDFKFLKKLFNPEDEKFLKKLVEHVNAGKIRTRKYYITRPNEKLTSLIEKRTVFDSIGKKIFEFEYQVEGTSYHVESHSFQPNKPNTLYWYKLTYLDSDAYISDRNAYRLYKAILKRTGDKSVKPRVSPEFYDKILQDQNARRAQISYNSKTK